MIGRDPSSDLNSSHFCCRAEPNCTLRGGGSDVLFRFRDQIIQHRVVTGIVTVRSGYLTAFSGNMFDLPRALCRIALRTGLNQIAEIVMLLVVDEIAEVQLLLLTRAGALQRGEGLALRIAQQRITGMIGRCRRRLAVLCVRGVEHQIVVID